MRSNYSGVNVEFESNFALNQNSEQDGHEDRFKIIQKIHHAKSSKDIPNLQNKGKLGKISYDEGHTNSLVKDRISAFPQRSPILRKLLGESDILNDSNEQGTFSQKPENLSNDNNNHSKQGSHDTFSKESSEFEKHDVDDSMSECKFDRINKNLPLDEVEYGYKKSNEYKSNQPVKLNNDKCNVEHLVISESNQLFKPKNNISVIEECENSYSENSILESKCEARSSCEDFGLGNTDSPVDY